MKPSIFAGTDDRGNPLEAGVLYSVYQTNDSASGGHLAYWTGKGWIDSDTLDDVDLSGEYGCGVYEYAARQNVPKISLETTLPIADDVKPPPGLTDEEKVAVPAAIQEFSAWFIKRHGIRGICDPMYVCNVAAFELGLGSGCGAFDGRVSEISDKQIDTLCSRLAFSYSSCIAESRGDPGELREQIGTLARASTRSRPRI